MNPDVERARLILWHKAEYERLLREADEEHEQKGGNGEYDAENPRVRGFDTQERGRAI